MVGEMAVAVARHRGGGRKGHQFADEVVERPAPENAVVRGLVHQSAEPENAGADHDDREKIRQGIEPGRLAQCDRRRHQQDFDGERQHHLAAVDL